MSSGSRDAPRPPRRAPYVVQVEEGRGYLWCSCGRSRTQPWCDGTHAGTDLGPVAFTAPVSGEFYMCGCKQSDNAPYCFGNCTGHARNRS